MSDKLRSVIFLITCIDYATNNESLMTLIAVIDLLFGLMVGQQAAFSSADELVSCATSAEVSGTHLSRSRNVKRASRCHEYHNKGIVREGIAHWKSLNVTLRACFGKVSTTAVSEVHGNLQQ